MGKTSRPHAESVIEMLRDDPVFAEDYLRAAMEQADQEDGRDALLSALRHVAQAQGMAEVTEREASSKGGAHA